MKKLQKLMIAVHTGEVDIADLDADQQETVLEGYRMLAKEWIDDPRLQELGKSILEVIQLTDDPFDVAIESAENRGSTYWEIETDMLH